MFVFIIVGNRVIFNAYTCTNRRDFKYMEHTGTGASYNETADQFSFACDKNRNFRTFFRDKCFFYSKKKPYMKSPSSESWSPKIRVQSQNTSLSFTEKDFYKYPPRRE